MVRSYLKGTLVAAALSCAGLALAQPGLLPRMVSGGTPAPQVQVITVNADEPIKPVPAPGAPAAAPGAAPGTAPATERIITVQDPGCPPRQCRVLREWALADGCMASEVQALDNGEKMTIVCGGCCPCTQQDYPCARIQGQCSRIFKWCQGCPPAECPKAPCVSGACASGTCGPDCCDAGGPRKTLADCTDKRFIDPCTGKFDYEKYLAELRCKHGNPGCCADGTPAGAPPGGDAPKAMPAGDQAAQDAPRFPVLHNLLYGKAEAKAEGPVATLPPVNDKTAAKTGSDTLWQKWFGKTEEPKLPAPIVKDAKPAVKDVSVDGTVNGQFDKDKYLAELRSKYGKGAADAKEAVAKKEAPKKDVVAKTEQKDDKDAAKVAANTPPKKDEKKPPTATLPKPAAPPAEVAKAKPPVKPAVEQPEPTDWRKSWGKTESQVAEKPAAEKKQVAEKALPAATPRPDPLSEPEKYAKKPEAPQWKLAGTPSPLMASVAAEPAPVAKKPEQPAKVAAQPVAQVEAPARASTAKVPMGAGSVMAAYGDLQPGQAVYLPVPMVTVPPTAHTVQPPQVAQNLPSGVNQYFANAFMGPDAPIPPAGMENQTAMNAFGNNPMMPPPGMGGPMPMMPPAAMMQMQQAAMQQAMMQQAMMQQAAMQQAAMQQGMMPQGCPMPMGQAPVMQTGYYPPAMPVQTYQPAVDPAAAQNLVQTLRESIYPSQREFAAESLSHIDWRTHPQVFDALLSAAREDPAPTVRACCVRCLAGMNVNSTLVTMTLQGLRNDADPRVRTEVEQALAKMAPAPKPSAVQPVSGRLPLK